jgi:hypothetical protein
MHIPPHMRQASPKFVPTCHHCGKIGHIWPNCFKFKPREHKSENSYSRKGFEGLCIMMRRVLSRLDEFDKSHKYVPRVKKAWVRKVDTIHPLSGSGGGLT